MDSILRAAVEVLNDALTGVTAHRAMEYKSILRHLLRIVAEDEMCDASEAS